MDAHQLEVAEQQDEHSRRREPLTIGGDGITAPLKDVTVSDITNTNALPESNSAPKKSPSASSFSYNIVLKSLGDEVNSVKYDSGTGGETGSIAVPSAVSQLVVQQDDKPSHYTPLASMPHEISNEATETAERTLSTTKKLKRQRKSRKQRNSDNEDALNEKNDEYEDCLTKNERSSLQEEEKASTSCGGGGACRPSWKVWIALDVLVILASLADMAVCARALITCPYATVVAASVITMDAITIYIILQHAALLRSMRLFKPGGSGVTRRWLRERRRHFLWHALGSFVAYAAVVAVTAALLLGNNSGGSVVTRLFGWRHECSRYIKFTFLGYAAAAASGIVGLAMYVICKACCCCCHPRAL